ncbi:MAG: hypothetical protein LOD87_14710, partial [Planifilum fulgidum]
MHEELSTRNADRDQAAGALRRLDRIWFPDGKTDRPHRPTGRQIAEAIARLLEDLGVPDRLREWRQDAWKAGRITEAREHEQAWQAVAGFLTEFAAVFRDEHMGPEEAGRILRGGLEQLRLGLIPPSLDQVLVGTVDRSRQPDVRVTFLMGANEGVFPGHPPEDPIFPDEDRQTLHAVGLELSADSRMRLFHERYLTYIALTRPRERLYVTFSHSDGMGRERKPSPIVLRLRRMFPDVKVISYPAAQQETPRQIEHPEILAARLPAVFREFRDGMLSPHLANGGVTAGLLAEWVGAYRWLAEHPEWRESLLRRIPALAEPRPVPALPPDLVNALYGTPMRTSVSRLESQA